MSTCTKCSHREFVTCKVENQEKRQCENCFAIDCIAFGYEEDCTICFERKAKFYNKCGHSFCICCFRRLKDCPLCRMEIRSCYLCVYKDTYTPEGKEHLRILYCQIYQKEYKQEFLFTLIQEYHKFMCLMAQNKDNSLNCSPSREIYQIWFKHSTDKENYLNYCKVLCKNDTESDTGSAVPYYPEDENYLEKYNRTLVLYRTFYGEISHEYTIWRIDSEEDIHVNIIDQSGEYKKIRVNPNTAVLELKKSLEERDIRLISQGRSLADNKTLKDYNIQNNDKLYIVLKLRGD